MTKLYLFAEKNNGNFYAQLSLKYLCRSRSSSRGDVNDQDAIQEKFYPPRFIQVPESMSIEEGRFCRMDFKVREEFLNTGENAPIGY